MNWLNVIFVRNGILYVEDYNLSWMGVVGVIAVIAVVRIFPMG